MSPRRFVPLFIYALRQLPSPPAASFSLASFAGGLGVAVILVSGCGEEDIEVYQVPKSTPATSAAGNGPPPRVSADSSVTVADPVLSYSLPAGWVETTPGRMVLRSIDTGDGVMLSVSSFPGDVGGMLANVNRWRRQLGLPPTSEAALSESMQPSPVGTPGTQRVGLSHDGQSVLVDVLSHTGSTWFFKLAGPQTATDNRIEPFDQFMQSVSFADASTPAAEPPE